MSQQCDVPPGEPRLVHDIPLCHKMIVPEQDHLLLDGCVLLQHQTHPPGLERCHPETARVEGGSRILLQGVDPGGSNPDRVPAVRSKRLSAVAAGGARICPHPDPCSSSGMPARRPGQARMLCAGGDGSICSLPQRPVYGSSPLSARGVDGIVILANASGSERFACTGGSAMAASRMPPSTARRSIGYR